MELLLSQLLDLKIILPSPSQVSCDADFTVHDIVLFERDDMPFPNCSLIFVQKEMSARISEEVIRNMVSLSCILVLSQDDPEMDRILKSADRLKLPIVLLPPHATISSAVQKCYALLLNKTQDLAVFSFDTMQTFFESLMKHRNESEYFMETAMELLDCPIAYANSDFTLQKNPSIPKASYIQVPFCAEYGDFDWEMAMESFHLQTAKLYPRLASGLKDTSISGYMHTNAYLKSEHRRVLIFPIEDISALYGYVLCAPYDQSGYLSPKQAITIQQLQLVLKLEVSKSDEIAQTVNHYYDFILDELLSSENTNFEELIQKYGLVKKTISDSYYVLMCGKLPSKDTDYIFREFLTSQRFNLIYAAVCSIFSSMQFFMFENLDSIILFIPSDSITDENDLNAKIRVLLESFGKQFNGVGISAMISKDQIRSGFFQAQKALAISRHSKDQDPCFYESLGILRYFFDNSRTLDMEPLLSNYRHYVLPVKEYDEKHGTKLLPTLQSYITLCSSTSAICDALFIHKNTLYSRLNKITQLIGHDLSDSDTLFNINLALKVFTLIDTGLLDEGV